MDGGGVIVQLILVRGGSDVPTLVKVPSLSTINRTYHDVVSDVELAALIQ